MFRNVSAVLIGGLLCSGLPAVTGNAIATTAPHFALAAATHYERHLAGRLSKVMVIAEENETDRAVLTSSSAPYLRTLAATYGQAANMHAGYPRSCPSLAAYLLITGGWRDGVCDDASPAQHQLPGPNVFSEVARSGRHWREYAESMGKPCRRTNTSDEVYLVRHAPPPYYARNRARCTHSDVPLGTATSGRLARALASGKLPAYSFVTPNACHDMHAAPGCATDLISKGDHWLRTWIPLIMAGRDYQAGRLVIIITWDEGTSTSNHIPTILISPHTNAVVSHRRFTHCSTLRTTESILGLPLLRCAKSAHSMRYAFDL